MEELRVGQGPYEEDDAQHWWPCEAFTRSGNPTASTAAALHSDVIPA